MRVFVKAFVSGNLGDDLFIRILCDRYKNHKFYISGQKKYKKFFMDIDNLTYVSNDLLLYKCIFKIINKIQYTFKLDVVPVYDYIDRFLIKKSKLNVLIGGSIFQEPLNRKHIINKRTIWNEKYIDRLHIVGCNFGPYRTKEFYNMYRDIFKKIGSICFRDKYSYELFKDLNNVNYATDVIFNLSNDNLYDKEYYVLSVIDVYKDNLCKDEKLGKNYIETMSKIINNINKNNQFVYLISFCEDQLDGQVIDKIIELVENKQFIKKYDYKGINYNEILDLIKNSKGVIATRFHAMILGLLYKKPVLPIVYDIKMENILLDINFKNYYININNITHLDIDLANKSLNKFDNSIDINKICNLAKNQFLFLDKLLK